MQTQKLNFMDAMKLEIERLRLNLSAAERDRALLAVGTDPASINPNLLLDDLYMVKLCRVASSLAMAGQAALEDKITTSIGLETSDDNAIDFWNVPGLGESCAGGVCEVHAENGEPVEISKVKLQVDSSMSFLCSHCGRKVCKICCAGRGAFLLATYSTRGSLSSNGVQGRSGSSHGSQVDVYTNNNHVTSDGAICKQCCSDVVLNALVLDYVRALLSSRRTARVGAAAFTTLDQVLGSSLNDGTVEKCKPAKAPVSDKVLENLFNGEESLAEFPFASFLYSVNSFPILILTPVLFKRISIRTAWVDMLSAISEGLIFSPQDTLRFNFTLHVNHLLAILVVPEYVRILQYTFQLATCNTVIVLILVVLECDTDKLYWSISLHSSIFILIPFEEHSVLVSACESS